MSNVVVVIIAPRRRLFCLLPLLLLLFRVFVAGGCFVVARTTPSSSSSSSFDIIGRRRRKSFAWTTCQNGTDVSILSAKLTPDPVRPGGAATFVLRGALLSDYLHSEEVIDVDIRYQSVPVYRDVLKLCETVRPDDDGEITGCPIRKKSNGTTYVTMEYDAMVPELAPSGEFDAKFVAKRSQDDEEDVGDVFCVEATLQVKGPFQRGLDAREEESDDDDDDNNNNNWVEEENERGIIKVS
jgi:hypothetical protein